MLIMGNNSLSNSSKEKIFLPWINNLKGIAMILIVFQHSGFLSGHENLQWFQQCVPIFLFCTAYLGRSKDIHDYF